MKLLFATTNKNKVPSVSRVLERYGIEVEQYDIDIPELQAESAVEIAAAKARWAFDKIGKPLMVIDSAFHIEKLKGFPGPNVKWATKQLGLEGYLRLLALWNGEADRKCFFEDALAYMDGENNGPRIFRRRALGHLAEKVRGIATPEEKSPLWRLFIPEGHEKTLAEMLPDELRSHRSDPDIERPYQELGLYLVSLRSEKGLP